MAYGAEINRANPSCILFLVDQSASMADPVAGGDGIRSKAATVTATVNGMLHELALRCATSSGHHDYFQVGVIGYGQHAGSILAGRLEGRDLVPISEVADNPLRVDAASQETRSASGEVVILPVRRPVWVDPAASGATRMVLALELARTLVVRFVRLHPDCFPPIVLNLTDGEATDGDPVAAAAGVREVSSTDGSTLLFNLHLGSGEAEPTTFPGSAATLPRDAQRLFSMSSPLPPHMRTYAMTLGLPVTDRSRGFVYDADASAIVQFLEVGTRADDLR